MILTGTAMQGNLLRDVERTAGYNALGPVLQKIVGLVESVVDSGPPANSRRLVTAIQAQLMYTEWSSWAAWRDFEREARDLPPTTSWSEMVARVFGISSQQQSTDRASRGTPPTS